MDVLLRVVQYTRIVVFVRQFNEDHLITLGLKDSVPVGAEMACEANPRSEALVQCGGGCCRRFGGSAFPSLKSIFSSFHPYGSLSALTLRRVQFTDRILHLIRET